MTRSIAQDFSPVRASKPGDVRTGPVSALPAVLKELGVSPQRVFARAGVKLGPFRNPDNRIHFDALGRLFEESVMSTGCHHLGLLVGEQFAMADLGVIGTLMQNSATIGDALQELRLNLHLHDRGAVPVLLRLEPSSVLLGYSIYKNHVPSMALLHDASIAIGFRILKQVCGNGWKPLRVQFSNSRPNDIHPYRRLFGMKPLFDAEVSGIAFASSWLVHAIANADPSIRDSIKILDQTIRGRQRIRFHRGSSRARSTRRYWVVMLLPDQWQRCFGIHERTLRKRLSAEGITFRQLVSQCRFELAKQLLQYTRLPVMDISAALNYSDPNVFTRAFHNWAGVSPREWRKEPLV